MYLKSQCGVTHGNQVQIQPLGSEPLSPQNEKEKKFKIRTKREEEEKKNKLEKLEKALQPRKNQNTQNTPKPNIPKNATHTPRNLSVGPQLPNQKATVPTSHHPPRPVYQPNQNPNQKPPAPDYKEVKNRPQLTPDPKSPHRSLLRIGCASTIGGAQLQGTGLATISPQSMQPRTPMSTPAREKQSETSEQSPLRATG